MAQLRVAVWMMILGVGSWLPLLAQQAAGAADKAAVPTLVKFSGQLKDGNGDPLTGIVGVTFALYAGEQGGAPLWLETQNVQPDQTGHYAVMLGSSSSAGLPAALFASGEARWVGAQAQGQREQPRVMLLSVPYAMKAADAATIGGLAPSAFVLAAPSNGKPMTVSTGTEVASSTVPPTTSNVTTTGGTANTLPLWTTTTNIQSSAVAQTGTGATARIGVGTTAPATTLDVKGASTLRGTLSLPATGTATATQGFPSQPLDTLATAFNSSTHAAVNQHFRWQAEPLGNDTATPSGKFNLLFASGSAAPVETGLSISSKGVFSFATGQTFPGTGTITGVTAGTDLSGGGTSGTVTLSLDTTKVPRLVAANSFSAAQSITNSASADALTITNSGAGAGANISTVNGTGVFVSVGSGNTGVFSSGGLGVEGFSTSGTGVYGSSSGLVGNTAGVYGTSGAASGVGTGGRAGVWGDSTSNVAVYGSSKNQTGVLGQSANATGVEGYNNAAGYGMIGHAQGGGNYGVGVLGESFGTGLFPNGNGSDGVDGFAHSANGSGVAGLNDSSGPGIYGYSASGAAGVFDGNVTVAGNVLANGGGGQSTYGSGAFITKSVTILGDVTIGGALVVEGNKYGFFIDHPLDPAHKYLAHTVIESPELKTMYDGLAILDSNGEAWVPLPDWFDALNRDCRYQLTSIGEPEPNLYIAQEVSGNRFKIAGGKPGGKVSWQVTGVRHDAYVRKHPFQAEREKTAAEQGYYVNPDAYGQPEERGIEWARHPELMPRAKEGVVKPRASPERAGVGYIR